MKKVIAFYFLLSALPMFAQRQAGNWIFGCSKMMTFNSGEPKMLTKSFPYHTWHSGGSVASNIKGQLMFYAAHNQILDSSHKYMPNGSFKGSSRTIQSSLIVPWPDSSHLFFVFSPGGSNKDSFRYSVVNMKLRNGLGDVDTRLKDIALPTIVSGKVTSVQHASHRGYWVVTPNGNSDTMHAYLITASGVSKFPVKSKTGVYAIAGSVYFDDYYGYLKLSPNGRKVCNINRYKTSMIADFDPSTGLISNVWDFTNYEVGIEFSPRGKYMYTISQDYVLSQFDLSAKSKSEFLKSRKTIDSVANTDYRYSNASLQVAPDGKIYIYGSYSQYLQIIHAPDSAGKLARLQKDGILYTSGTESQSHYGLPNFVQSHLYKPSFDALLTCTRDTVFFKISETYNLDSAIWDFDDSASGTQNVSKAQSGVYHIYNKSGYYSPRLICYYKNYSDTIIQKIFINVPKPDLGKDTLICKGDYIGLFNKSGYFKSYKWSTGQSTLNIFVSQQAKYHLTVKDFDGCVSSDTIEVKNYTIQADFSLSDTARCLKNNFFNFKETTRFSGQKPKAPLWYLDEQPVSQDTTLNLSLSAQGNYKIKLVSSTQNFCIDSITKIINVWPNPNAGFTINDTQQCIKGNNFEFINLSTISNGSLSFDWDLGDLKSTHTSISNKFYQKYGQYKIALVAISENGCKDTAFQRIKIEENPVAKFTWVPTCSNSPVQFNFTGSRPNGNIKTVLSWDFNGEEISNSDNPLVLFKGAGIKKVKLTAITDKGCSDTSNADVEVKLKATANFNADDLCEGDSAEFINKSVDAASFVWKFGDGILSYQASPKHLYKTDGVTQTFNITLVAKSGCSDSLTKAVTVNAAPQSGFNYTVSGRLVYFNATEQNAVKYKWLFGDGSIDSADNQSISHNYLKFPSGKYTTCLEVTNLAGCRSITCNEIGISSFVNRFKNESTMKIYPNPANSFITIELPLILNSQERKRIVILDAVGKLILEKNLNFEGNKTTLELSGLKPGVYYIQLNSKDNVFEIQKLILTN